MGDLVSVGYVLVVLGHSTSILEFLRMALLLSFMRSMPPKQPKHIEFDPDLPPIIALGNPGMP